MARKALYKHAKHVTVPDDGTSPVGSDEWNANPDAEGMLGFTPQTANSSTIIISANPSGTITPTDSVTVVAAHTGTNGTITRLVNTETNQYDLLYLFADTNDTIILTNTASPSTAGDVQTISGANETLSKDKPTILMRKGDFWFGYGGGTASDLDTTNFAAATLVTESEGIGSNDNDTTLPTSAAVKDYVDTQITAEDLDTAGDSGTGAIDLNSQSLTVSGGSGITTTASSQAITIAGDDATTSAKGVASFSSDNFAVSSGAVTIKTGGVVEAEIADNAVTLEKMAGLVRGKIIVGDASGNPSALTVGAEDTVLTVDASGDVGWEAPSGGGAHTEQDFTVQSGHASNPSSGTAVLYVKTIDSNNEGLFIKMKKNGSIQFVQVG